MIDNASPCHVTPLSNKSLSSFPDKLFGPMEFSRRDLAALDIMRGRDSGLPDYNTVRKYFNLDPVTDWQKIGEKLKSANQEVCPNYCVLLLSVYHYLYSSVLAHPLTGQPYDCVRSSASFFPEVVSWSVREKKNRGILDRLSSVELGACLTRLASTRLRSARLGSAQSYRDVQGRPGRI